MIVKSLLPLIHWSAIVFLLVAGLSTSKFASLEHPNENYLTIESLRYSKFPASQSYLVVDGYSKPGDRGFGCRLIRGDGDQSDGIRDGNNVLWKFPVGLPLSPGCFGAKIDGQTDDTLAVREAISIASHQLSTFGVGSVLLPAGVFRLARLDLPGHLSLRGLGRGVTILRAVDDKSNIIFSHNQTYVQIADLTVSGSKSNILQKSNALIDLTDCQHCSVDNISVEDAFVGVLLSGANSSDNRISGSNFVRFYEGIVIDGGADHFIGDVFMNGDGSNPLSANGISILRDGLTFITNSEIAHTGNGLALVPGDGDSVNFLTVSNAVLGDTSSQSGLYVAPTGSGIVNLASFSNTWTGTNGQAGIKLECKANRDGAIGQIDGISFNQLRSINNWLSGISIACGKHISINQSTIAGNNQAGGDSSGVDVIGNVDDLVITKNHFVLSSTNPDGGHYIANRQSSGIHIYPISVDHYVIRGNFLRDPTKTKPQIRDEGLGGNKYINQNFQ